MGHQYRVRGGVHSGEVFDAEDMSPEKRRGIEASGGRLTIADAGDAEAFEAEFEENTEKEVEKVTLEGRKDDFEDLDSDAPKAPAHAQVDDAEVREAAREAEASHEPLPDDAPVHRLPTTHERNEAAGGDVHAEPEAEEAPDATPAAEELAEEKGVDLEKVEGSGKDGRITKPDVEAAAD